jgi:hypothetical protein
MERNDQIDKGFSIDHDLAHGDELLRAAACYLDWAASKIEGSDDPNEVGPHVFWPWDDNDWNPGTPQEAMIKSAAMVAAYYDANLAEVVTIEEVEEL